MRDCCQKKEKKIASGIFGLGFQIIKTEDWRIGVKEVFWCVFAHRNVRSNCDVTCKARQLSGKKGKRKRDRKSNRGRNGARC